MMSALLGMMGALLGMTIIVGVCILIIKYGLKRLSNKHKAYFFCAGVLLVLALCWWINESISQSAKLRIVRFAGKDYGIGIADIRLIEREPGWFRDSEGGVIAFKCNRLLLKMERIRRPCQTDWPHFEGQLKKSGPKSEAEMKNWYCESHVISQGENYSLYYDSEKEIYFLRWVSTF